MQLKPALGGTVGANLASSHQASAHGLVEAFINFTRRAASTKPQMGDRSFATFWRYLKMVRQRTKP